MNRELAAPPGPGWKCLPTTIQKIASGYFARAEGIDKVDAPSGDWPFAAWRGMIVFAPYRLSWKKSFASEFMAVSSLARWLAREFKIEWRVKKVGEEFWLIWLRPGYGKIQ